MSLLLLFKKHGVTITGTASFNAGGEDFAIRGIGDQSKKHLQRGYTRVFGKAVFEGSTEGVFARGVVIPAEVNGTVGIIEGAEKFIGRGLTWIPEVKGTATIEEFGSRITARGFVTEGNDEIIPLIQLLAEMM